MRTAPWWSCRPAPDMIPGTATDLETCDRVSAVAETHSATVFFFGDRAYKVKKPVDLGFLDFRDRAAREAVCHREVDLNRRLAPDVYLGVADVTDPDGVPCDHLVVMRRMPADRRLSTLVTAGHSVEMHLWHVAHQLATLHARSPRSAPADEAAGVVATRHRWDTNTDALIGLTGTVFDELTVATVHGLACRYLDGRGPLLAERVAHGRGVDGHGDLLADDIFCLDDGPRILDCVEFDDHFRLGDGLADAAFLAMDLERLGRPGLAEMFLAAYGEHAGDTWPASLAHHHIAYRAQVRAKVTAIRAGQGAPGAAAKARDLLDLAESHLDQGQVRLILVGGLPGTGKSTLAASLGDALHSVVLRSDVVRKELAGVAPDGRSPAAFGEGIYSAASTAATYRALLEQARIALSHGETVLLDASWMHSSWRDAAHALAAEAFADLVELRCDAPAVVTTSRLLRRAAEANDVSDATPEIATAMAEAAFRWPTATTIDTSGDPSEATAAALSRIRSPEAPSP